MSRQNTRKQLLKMARFIFVLLVILALYIAVFIGLEYLLFLSGVAIFSLLVFWSTRYFYAVRQRNRHLEKVMKIKNIRNMNPFDFERRVAGMYEKLGYRATNTPDRADNGIDVILKKDGLSIAVQVKRYAGHNLISEPMLRDFYGSYIGVHDKGIYVTTSSYTRPAKLWAKDRDLELVDWDGWTELEIKAGDKV